ncbi:SPT3 Dosage dependent suppressor of Ty-induced promoter mutations-like protein [Chytridiales sp. JEL 0842]|nr:SPT3 Dosage dependent suppressor of Ty-induced promoter mutations-like protein [Chytridiales sp. JEL 0842]
MMGDKVSQWSHVRLPSHMAFKTDRSKKTAITKSFELDTSNINPSSLLNLEATVLCASDVNKDVLMCPSCVLREKKRSQKREMSRKRLEGRANSHQGPEPLSEADITEEDVRKILLFNCSPLVDFSSGDTILPSRITCYCRHHNEKRGFVLYFVARNQEGEVVGTGCSPPIMITDDHKAHLKAKAESNGAKVSTCGKRGRAVEEADEEMGDCDGAKGAELEQPAPKRTATLASLLRLDSLFPSSIDGTLFSNPFNGQSTNSSRLASNEPQVKLEDNTAMTDYGSPITQNSGSSASPTVHHMHLPQSPNNFDSLTTSPSPSQAPSTNSFLAQNQHSSPWTDPLIMSPFNPLSPVLMDNTQLEGQNQFNLDAAASMAQTLFAFTSANPTAPSQIPRPRIDRVIPGEGPMHGSIEITLLGTGFTPDLTVLIGDTPAPLTHFSPSTLVCILPPSPIPGPVPVCFKEVGVELGNGMEGVRVFVYKDETERALMELALQVVGLRMTGKLEDARNVAMKIVNDTASSSDSAPSANPILQLAVRLAARSSNNLELILLESLMASEPRSHSFASATLNTPHRTTRQTLLHFACLSGKTSLAKYLIASHVDVDARDRNGFTPLHFAVLGGNVSMIRALLEAGANMWLSSKMGMGVWECSVVEARRRGRRENLLEGVGVVDVDGWVGESEDEDDEVEEEEEEHVEESSREVTSTAPSAASLVSPTSSTPNLCAPHRPQRTSSVPLSSPPTSPPMTGRGLIKSPSLLDLRPLFPLDSKKPDPPSNKSDQKDGMSWMAPLAHVTQWLPWTQGLEVYMVEIPGWVSGLFTPGVPGAVQKDAGGGLVKQSPQAQPLLQQQQLSQPTHGGGGVFADPFNQSQNPSVADLVPAPPNPEPSISAPSVLQPHRQGEDTETEEDACTCDAWSRNVTIHMPHCQKILFEREQQMSMMRYNKALIMFWIPLMLVMVFLAVFRLFVSNEDIDALFAKVVMLRGDVVERLRDVVAGLGRGRGGILDGVPGRG